MTTRSLFSQKVTSEQDLYEDLVIESVSIYGHDVYYIARESMGKDVIFADDIANQYKDAYPIEMCIENIEGFEGEGDLFTKFGIEIRDACTFVVSKRRWNEEIASKRPENESWWRPREGDLIYLPLSSSIFQIMKCEEKTPFFQIGRLNVFRMSCELYDYAGEDFDTGLEEIDRTETAFAYQYKLTLTDSADGYSLGERVSQTFASGVVMSGEVVDFQRDSAPALFIAHSGADDGKFHSFITGLPIIGLESGQSWTPTLVEELQNIEKSSQGDDFKNEAGDILDFTESNPFGEPLQ